MKAYMMMSPGRGEMVDLPKPVPKHGEVRVRTAYAGICGSDLHAYHGHHARRILPLVPGHEISGWIDAFGPGVNNLLLGGPVVIYPEQGCQKCDVCLSGWTNLCSSKVLLGTEKWPGGFSEYFCAPVENLLSLPTDMDLRTAALAEPLAVAIHAFNQAKLDKSDNILIFGCGGIGGVLTFLAKQCKCRHVTVCDLAELKLEVATALGADATINTSKAPVQKQLQAFGLPNPDKVFIAASPTHLIGESFSIASPRGTIVLVGQFNKPGVIDIDQSRIKEQTIVGSFTYGVADMEAAIALLTHAPKEIHHLITEEIILADVEGTIIQLSSSKKEAVKVLIKMNR